MTQPIVISILTNASKANAGLDKTLTKTQKVGAGFKRMAGPAVLGLGALGAAAVSTVKDLGRIERINTQTAATIKSTGGAARVTGKHVESLAGNLENLTATEAESIQEGANVLLTFTNIRNGVGKTNKIFDESVSIVTDMSRALGTDLKQQSMQVGKALNAPIKGVSALSRVGVTFTQGQKDQIKALTESGNVMGAQKIILAELKKEFGGSGAAFAKTTEGQLALVGHQFGTLAESLASGLLPVLKDVAVKAQGVAKWMQKNQSTVKVAIIVFAALATGVLAVNAAMAVATAVTTAYTAAATVMNTVTKVGTVLKYAQGTAWVAWRVTVLAGTAAMGLARAAMIGLNLAFSANPIGLVVLAIAALVGGVILAYNKVGWFRAGVQAAWAGIKIAFVATVNFLKPFVLGAFKAIATYVRVYLTVARTVATAVWSGIKAVVRAGVNYVKTYVKGIVFVATVFRSAFNAARSAVTNGVSRIVSAARSILSKIRSALSSARTLLTDIGGWIVDGLRNGITSAAGRVLDAVQSLVNKIPAKIRKFLKIASPSKVTTQLGRYTGDGLAKGIEDSRPQVVRALDKVARTISDYAMPSAYAEVDAKGKATIMDPLDLVTNGTATNVTVNIDVRIDSGMTEAEMGRAYDRAIRAAKRRGLVPK